MEERKKSTILISRQMKVTMQLKDERILKNGRERREDFVNNGRHVRLKTCRDEIKRRGRLPVFIFDRERESEGFEDGLNLLRRDIHSESESASEVEEGSVERGGIVTPNVLQGVFGREDTHLSG